MDKDKKQFDIGDVLGGTLNIFGLKIDLQDLLSSSEDIMERMEELREKLKAAGGKETLSDSEWRQGGVTVTGHIRTRGLLGDREFHVGTVGAPASEKRKRSATQTPEEVEPPVDVFYEDQEITIVADVPGVDTDDFELVVEGRAFRMSTRPTARRRYKKELELDVAPDPQSMETTCHNGVLQIKMKAMRGGSE